MATLGEIPIADGSSVFDSGAAFLCAQKCPVNEIVYLNSGAEVEVRSANAYVVARVRGSVGPNDAFNRAHEAAQEGLDQLSIGGKADLSIKNASDEYIVWWQEDSKQVLRVVGTSTLIIEVGGSSKLFDRDGSPIELPAPPKLIYNESLRYFRLSQITEDLFDAFRNMYLAFELLLEHHCPRHSPREREGVWLKRALSEANRVVPLSRVYKTIGPDVVSDIYDDLYAGIRCRLFHAKHGSRLLPQSAGDRRSVSEGLERLTDIFLLLAQELLNARRPGGLMTYEGFAWLTEPVMSGSTVLVSGNDMPLDASATLKSPPFVGAVPMLTRAAPELSRPGLRTILGSIPATDLKGLPKIARFGWAHDGHLMMSGAVEAPLTHDGVDRIEAQMGVQLRNAKRPKELFKA